MKSYKNNSLNINTDNTFVCTTNEVSDRHKFIGEVYPHVKQIIVDRKKFKAVKNPNDYWYHQISKLYHYPQHHVSLVGITGTDGKTTSAWISYTLLRNFIACTYLGTNGYISSVEQCHTRNTTPAIEDIIKFLDKTRANKGKYMIMEVSSEGLLHQRTASLLYKRALLTNITGDHLNSHKTMTNYIQTKKQLFKHLTGNGIAILNKDDQYYHEFKNYIKHKVITYGQENADYTFENIQQNDTTTSFDLIVRNKCYHITSPLMGVFNVYNLVLSLALLETLKISITKVLPYISKLEPVIGRMEFLDYRQDYKILLDYAHTKNATKEVLSLVNKIKHHHIITVVGCAGGREKEKRKDIGTIVTSLSDRVIFTMDDPRNEEVKDIIKEMLTMVTAKNYTIIYNRTKAINKALKMAKKDDIVVILGKGRDNYMAIKDEYVPYCDKTVIDNYFKRK